MYNADASMCDDDSVGTLRRPEASKFVNINNKFEVHTIEKDEHNGNGSDTHSSEHSGSGYVSPKYFTVNYPVIGTKVPNAQETSKSLTRTTKNESQKPDDIIELKTIDANNNMSTSIVVFRNNNHEFRHINIIDYRVNHVKNKKHSSTMPKNKNIKDREMCYSSDDFILSPINDQYSDALITIDDPNPKQSLHPNKAKKLPMKALKRIAESFRCCQSLSDSKVSENEIVTKESYPAWKFILDEFDDITYLSSGAQGLIYTAKFRDTVVALKKIKDKSKRDEVSIENLISLSHENVITFLGMCEEKYIWLVMEFCTRGQLFDVLHRSIEISSKDTVSWACQICHGMAYLHRMDIIHRDLKSPNILLSDNNILKIIDFEFSKDCCESKILNSFVGTIAWMAPEVLRQEVQTKKVDVWSYGVVLWEMMTREIPYAGIESMSILFGVGKNCLSLPICSTLPLEIKELLYQCWDKSPDKRPSFQDISGKLNYYFDDLEQWSQEEFILRQLEWKNEIKLNFQEMIIDASRVEAELIRRRTQELSEVKKLKELYAEKLNRVDYLIDRLKKCLQAVDQERKRNESEWKLIQRLKPLTSPNERITDSLPNYFSFTFPNPEHNIQLKPIVNRHIRSPKIFAKHNSCFENIKSPEHSIKKKLSSHSFRDRNGGRTVKTKFNFDPEIKNRKIINDHNHKSDRFKTTVNENSKFKESAYSMPNNNVHNFPTTGVSGIVNLAFEGSNESSTTLIDLKRRSSNMLKIALFGSRASISDIDIPRGDFRENQNLEKCQSLFRSSTMEPSIPESSQNDVRHDMNDIREDIEEDVDMHGVVLRQISGRSKPPRTNDLNAVSFDLSMFNAEFEAPFSLIEKEAKIQCLIEPHDFLAQMNSNSKPTECGDRHMECN